MFPLFESIFVINGSVQNIEFHQKRFFNSYLKYYGTRPNFALTDPTRIPKKYSIGMYKLRILYNDICKKHEFINYSKKNINSLKVVFSNDISYQHKYTFRNNLNNLFSLKDHCDDVLIVKNNLITDTSFGNIVFNNGKDWITPKSYLLNGTCRSRLIKTKKIEEREVKVSDLNHFKEFKIINAFRDLEETSASSMKHLFF